MVISSLCTADDTQHIPQYIEKEFERNNIKPFQIHKNESSLIVPSDLEYPYSNNSAFWGILAMICSEGGYNLGNYAGKELTFLSYQIKEYYNNELLLAWVAYDKENKTCVCVYKSVRSDSSLIPGIFSVTKKTIKESITNQPTGLERSPYHLFKKERFKYLYAW